MRSSEGQKATIRQMREDLRRTDLIHLKSKWPVFIYCRHNMKDSVTGEMNARFGERNSQLVQAMCALDPGNPNFLDEQGVRPLLELTNTTLVESEFTVAQQFLQTEMTQSTEARWTLLSSCSTTLGLSLPCPVCLLH